MLNHLLRRAALVAALALPLAAPLITAPQAAAQETEEVVRETHGAWDIRCLGSECAMVQALTNTDGATVLVVSISKLAQPQAADTGETIVGVARILTPLNVQLPEGLGLRIDDSDVRSAPYLVCTRVGCHARPPLTSALVDQLKAGNVAEFLTVVSTPEGRRIISSPISLTGFTAAFNAL